MVTWSESFQSCEETGSQLVSIESFEEWSFLKQTIQTMETKEYLIGLKKYTPSGEWRWISDNSTVNASKQGAWPWASDEPKGKNEYCVVMYKDYLSNYGLYNNVDCESHSKLFGYICEKAVDCNDTGFICETTVGKRSRSREGSHI